MPEAKYRGKRANAKQPREEEAEIRQEQDKSLPGDLAVRVHAAHRQGLPRQEILLSSTGDAASGNRGNGGAGDLLLSCQLLVRREDVGPAGRNSLFNGAQELAFQSPLKKGNPS